MHDVFEIAFIAQINSVRRPEKRRIGQGRHTLTQLSHKLGEHPTLQSYEDDENVR